MAGEPQKKFSVLVVDDERIIRDGLRKTIPWESFGFEIKGCVEDGEAALEFIQRTPPDVVLTDIRMPKLNGIELLKRIKKRCPEIEVVLLSSYDEFELARDGIRFGAYGYVLKLHLVKEIKTTFSKLYELLRRENQRRERVRKAESDQKSVYLDLVIRRLINSIDSEKQSTGKIIGVLPDETLEAVYCVVFIALFRNSEAGSASAEGVAAMLKLDETNLPFVLIERAGGILIQIFYSGDFDRDELALRVTDYWRKHLHMSREEGLYLHIGIGRTINGLKELQDSIRSARQASFHIAPGEMSSLTAYSDIESDGISSEIPVPDRGAIIRAVLSGKSAQAAELVQAQFLESGKTHEAKINLRLVQSSMVELVGYIASHLKDRYNFTDNTLFADIYSRLINTKTYPGLIAYFTQAMSLIACKVSRLSTEPNRDNIARVVGYIDKNLLDKLDLKSLSDVACLSTSHMSALFKQYTGYTVGKYINKRKMEHALQHIQDGDRIKDVAMLFGYQDAHHFSRMFKKEFGIVPSEIRRRSGAPEV